MALHVGEEENQNDSTTVQQSLENHFYITFLKQISFLV
jgi:hypothetical protein